MSRYLPCTVLLITLFFGNIGASANEHCGNNDEAKLLAQLIINDEKQNRLSIRCNKLLTEIAVAKAKKMLDFGMVAHNLGGSPNARLSDANYKLPKYYGTDFNSNQVEAIAGGYSTAKEVWRAFKGSDSHRIHLLGEHEFYLEQDEIGVALIKEWYSPHVEYWVVYLTKGFQKNQINSHTFDEIPNKNIFIIQATKEKKPEL